MEFSQDIFQFIDSRQLVLELYMRMEGPGSMTLKNTGYFYGNMGEKVTSSEKEVREVRSVSQEVIALVCRYNLRKGNDM